MTRKAPRADTLKILYALSGNECAHPRCKHPIFNDDGLYVSELCHIEAAEKGGARYNEGQTDEERRSVKNLLFMCYRHHKESNYYDKNKMCTIKNEHEKQFSEESKIISSQMISQIQSEIEYFWNRQKSKKFQFNEFKPNLNFELNIMSIFEKIDEVSEKISNLCNDITTSDELLFDEIIEFLNKHGINTKIIANIPYYENPFINRNWETNHLAVPNFFSYLDLYIKQLKIKVFEEKIQHSPDDTNLRNHLLRLRLEFEKLYNNSHIA